MRRVLPKRVSTKGKLYYCWDDVDKRSTLPSLKGTEQESVACYCLECIMQAHKAEVQLNLHDSFNSLANTCSIFQNFHCMHVSEEYTDCILTTNNVSLLCLLLFLLKIKCDVSSYIIFSVIRRIIHFRAIRLLQKYSIRNLQAEAPQGVFLAPCEFMHTVGLCESVHDSVLQNTANNKIVSKYSKGIYDI